MVSSVHSGLRRQRKAFVQTSQEGSAVGMDGEPTGGSALPEGATDHCPVLRSWDPRLKTIVGTDASDGAVGAVIVQIDDVGERVVEYASRTLSPPEKNYAVMEKECLAVVWAVEKFRPYLEGHPVTLETDHQPLVWLHSMKKPSPKMLRWILRLEEFQLEVRYRPGRENKVADCLSRRVPGQEGEVAAVQVEIHGSWSKDQEDDNECQTLRRKWCAPGKDPAKAAPFLVQKGVLYNVSRQGHLRLVVPESRRKEVLETHHDHPSAGHSGVQRTLEKIQRNFFWSRMRQDVEGYVKTCEVCQKHKVDGKPP